MKDVTKTAQDNALNENEDTTFVHKPIDCDQDSLRGKRKHYRQDNCNEMYRPN